jgi:hypothetical protein
MRTKINNLMGRPRVKVRDIPVVSAGWQEQNATLIRSSPFFWPRFSPPCQCLLDPFTAFPVRDWQIGQKSIGACLKILRNLRESRHRKRVPASFDIAEGLPVNTEQFGEAFLGKTRTDACGTNISPNDSQWITIWHAPFSGDSIIVDIEHAPT